MRSKMIMIEYEIKENVIGWLHVLTGNTPSLYVCILSSHSISVARVMQLCIFDINDFYFAHETNRVRTMAFNAAALAWFVFYHVIDFALR